MAGSTLQHLRDHAVTHSLFEPTTLKAAINRLAFVQADPIRSPARAQDLILRHRVRDYRAGDLERKYRSLNIEEDVLYAYGFLPRSIWRMLHPRKTKGLSKLEKQVLEIVTQFGRMHPRELESHLGRQRVVNAWGGYSKATTRALDHMHYKGLLRIAGRENGVRVYEAITSPPEALDPSDRLGKLIMVVANVLAPIPRKSLQSTIARFARLGNTRTTVDDLLRQGELEEGIVDGITYLWPARKSRLGERPQTVRFLAPFDPLVWDRRRFEHLWQWPYRFEAYTPPAKRVRGYYAMPLLWGNDVIGWANARNASGGLDVEVGFVDKRPAERAFSRELAIEIDRLNQFLGPVNHFAGASTETATPSV